MIEHRSVVNYMLAYEKLFGIGPSDRSLQFASFSFDASVEELFSALSHGATAFIRGDDMLESVSGFLDECLRQRLTIMSLPTAFWHELCDHLASDGLRFPPSVRLMVIGGAAAQPDKLGLWRHAVGDAPAVANTYGPTEGTIVATAAVLGPGEQDQLRVSIGRPVSRCAAYVVDEHRRLAEPGVVGDLFLGGVGVARGYWRRPELTEAAFVPDPFAASPDSRMYRTGDLASYRADGQIEYWGRADDQVKIRGFRVELGEIEGRLRSHPSVRQAAVVFDETGSGQQALRAFAVADGGSVSAEELSDFLSASLPTHMVPASVALVGALPISPSGKVDKRRLLESVRDVTLHQVVAPRDDLESRLCAMWERLLGRSPVGVQDDFFALGGHSLLALRLVAEVAREFGVKCGAKEVFRGPTVEALADVIRRSGGVGGPAAARGESGHSDGTGRSGPD